MDGSTQAHCAKCGGRVARSDKACSACGITIRFATQDAVVPLWAKAFIFTERAAILLVPPIFLAILWKNGTKPTNLGFLIVVWLGALSSNNWGRCDEVYAKRRLIGYVVIVLFVWVLWYFILRPFEVV